MIERQVVDDQDGEPIDTTENWFRICIVDNNGVYNVAIREVNLLNSGTIDNPNEVAGKKAAFFDFRDKTNVKAFVDALGT